jgi:hypothetical protein
MLTVRVLIGIAVIFDVLIAISIPFVPAIRFYIVAIDFTNNMVTINVTNTTTGTNTTLSVYSSSFNGQVSSAGKSISVQSLVQLQVSLCVFAKQAD